MQFRAMKSQGESESLTHSRRGIGDRPGRHLRRRAGAVVDIHDARPRSSGRDAGRARDEVGIIHCHRPPENISTTTGW